MPRSAENGSHGIEEPAFDFQIAPEIAASNSTTMPASAAPPRADDYYTTDFDILTGSPDPDHPQAGRWMEVCPGGCNKKDKSENDDFDAGINDDIRSSEYIAAQLYEKSLSICRVAHPRGAEVLEVFDTRIVWAKNSPKPAYLSPSQKKIVHHSTAVTSGHLALIQARGNIDKIGLGYRTYDFRHDEQTNGRSSQKFKLNK
ncbi:hypothetical protein F5B18DRAFT_672341 [Nemania serpens]|nr:hypothetical protein F5B18DRAFT_672341 [Nemania serpens]